MNVVKKATGEFFLVGYCGGLTPVAMSIMPVAEEETLIIAARTPDDPTGQPLATWITRDPMDTLNATQAEAARNDSRLSVLWDNANRLHSVCVNGDWVRVATVEVADGPDSEIAVANVRTSAGQVEFLARNEPCWYTVPVESIEAYRLVL